MLQVSILSVSVSIFNFVSVRLNCQCQIQFRFFVSGFTDIDSKLRYPYLSLSYAPWSEGGCLSSAKLRSTDSVNPRAVLSRVLPRYRLYSKQYSVFSNFSATETVSPSGPPGLFKGVTTPMSGVLARFPWLLPVRNPVAGYGASAVTCTPDQGHVAEVKNQFHGVSGCQCTGRALARDCA